jgi:hypothetical protein
MTPNVNNQTPSLLRRCTSGSSRPSGKTSRVSEGDISGRRDLAERKTAASYLKAFEKIGILESQKVGKENLCLNKKL